MKRLMFLTALILVSGVTSSLLTVNAIRDGALPALATALGVNVIVSEVSINQAANSYCETVSLNTTDTSGLTNWNWSFCGTGTTPRYPIAGTATLSLP